MSIVSKSDFAQLLGIDRSRVSQLVRQRLPTTDAGKIDLEQGLAWVVRRVGYGRYPDGIAVRARALLRATDAGQMVDTLPRKSAADCPPHLRWLSRLSDDPLRLGLAAAAVEMTYRTPAVAASLAVEAGASMKTAFAMQEALKAAMVVEALEIAGIPDDLVDWDSEAFRPVDWYRTAEVQALGEPVDIEAWKKHVKDTWGGGNPNG
jgi:hypothetical protein